MGYRHGQGAYTWPDGDKYVGEFKDDKPNGQGTYTWCFYCSWCSSLPGGTNSSISSFADGRKYEGEWKDGVYHGHGTYTISDGSKYEGEWKDGKYDGQGTETCSSGWKYVVEWREGKPWNITIYGKSGIIILKYVNGVEQK